MCAYTHRDVTCRSRAASLMAQPWPSTVPSFCYLTQTALEPKYTSPTLVLVNDQYGRAQSTPQITARDRAILEYASHPILLYAVLK